MSNILETLNNPFALMTVLILTGLSTYYSWIAVRRKHAPSLLLGVGFGIPTFDILSWQFWIAGVAVCALGMWLRSTMESL